MTYVVAFTGTRNGLTPEQWETLEAQLREITARCLREGVEALGVHGDCVGADAEFDLACQRALLRVACRPCTEDGQRARTGAPEIAAPITPMARNRELVAGANFLIACPPNRVRIKSGSGTWATIGFARRAGLPHIIIFPEGDLESWPASV